MTEQVIACHKANYGGKRRQTQFLVIHYTAGDGDTAENNGMYFAREPVGASAHWFVDETTAVLSVPEDCTAWHCGAGVYLHPNCRNGNSIAIELCSWKDAQGNYYIPERTLENGQELVRKLMKKYGIPMERVLRHYDVTGKKCPAPLVEAGAWEEFLEGLMRYDTADALPQWGRQTVDKLMEQGFLQGDGQGLDLSRDMLRMLVILDRAGLFAEKPGTAAKNPEAAM